MEKENSTEEEPVGFPAPKNVNEVDQNIDVPNKNDLSNDEMVGTTAETEEVRQEIVPYVHEEDKDMKPSTAAAKHLLDNELGEETKSSGKRHLVDAEMEDTSNDMEIRSQEDDNNKPSSSEGLSNSENSVGVPYVHEDDEDMKPSTAAAKHLLDNELDEEINSSGKKHLVDSEMEDTANDMEIRSQEDDKFSDNNTSSSSAGFSNSESSVNTHAGEPDIKKEGLEKGNSVNDIALDSTATGIETSGPEVDNSIDNSPTSSIQLSNPGIEITGTEVSGEPDIQKEDQEKSKIVDEATISCTATDIEIRTREEDNFTTNSSSSSPAQPSSSENSINVRAHEPDIQKENHEKGIIVNDAEEGGILVRVEDKDDTGQSPETTIVNHQSAENIMKSKDVSHHTFSKNECECSTSEERGDMKSDPTDNTSASNIFRNRSRGSGEHNDSNEKDNIIDSSKGDSQEVKATTLTKPRWSLSNLSIRRISREKNQGNKADLKGVFLEAPDLKPIKGRIILYTKLWCQDCKEARKFLRSRRLRYSEINLDVYPSRKVELEQITGSLDVPKVFFNHLLIGGLNELKGLDESGELEEKIEYVTSEGPSPNAPLPPLSGEDDVSSRGSVDELAVIVRKMKGSIVVKDRFYKFRRVTNCFLASDAVDFLSEDQFLEREGAIEFGRKLAKELFFQHVFEENTFEDGSHLYRFLDQDPIISQCQNIPRGIIQLKRQPLVELSRRLRFCLYAILEAYTSEDGKHIAYRTIHGSEEFARYLRIAEELQRLDLNKTVKEERLAFFINLYNLMSIHAILVWGHPERALDRRKLFNDFKYVIGGCAYSLSDIQNGILRANQRPPYALGKPFDISDKRFKVALPYPEPLIHFALVSGNRSAPALRSYSPKRIDMELMEAARGFLQSGAFVPDLDSLTISVTKILKWYSVDFGKNEVEVLKHAANYLEVEKTITLLELLDNTQLKVVYQPYDWRLNS